ncbi:MAG: hypothetical protein J1E42_01730 [Akkermansiaceae bacterium]|nr:hypothetical protein [Akkermansiaceae bacterium]
MDKQITIRALGDWKQGDELTTVLTRYRRELMRLLQSMGFEQQEWYDAASRFTARFARPVPHQPELRATLGGSPVCVCFAPAAPSLMELQALHREQCDYSVAHYPENDIYYASVFAEPQEGKLYLLGPVRVRHQQTWLSHELEQSQFLPLSLHTRADRYTPLFGGAALLKLDRIIIPHVLEHGSLPRFTVRGLFEDAEQGECSIYGLMAGGPPTHFMLVESTEAGHAFHRPFFYYGERPGVELELLRCDGAPVLELLDQTGRTLYAECLEAVLFPDKLLRGKHYRCTLSLVADRCRTLRREWVMRKGPLLDRVMRDYEREHGEAPPADFSVRVRTDSLRTLFQEPQHPYAELCGKVVRAELTTVDGQPAALLSVQALADNDSAEVQVFVGAPVGLDKLPEPGEVVECAGFLYVSPDEVLPEAESWQDSGRIAALQHSRELAQRSLHAYTRFSAYSLAQGVVASAFARAGYRLLEPPGAPTRGEATFVVGLDSGAKKLLFVDTGLGDDAPQHPYTEEQKQAILQRKQAEYGAELSAHSCVVRLRRHGEGEDYDVQLQVEPACAELDPQHIICDATQIPLPNPPSEAQACRIVCNAICTQEWETFARIAAEDLRYTSLVNGVSTTGKIAFIRYMAERKQLWVEQQGWPGMSMETGSILYKGVRRPCFMITCYGHRIGAAVVTLRHGLLATMETLPQELNDTYEPDAESASELRLFHPYRGRLTPHPAQQTPLQRFAGAYLQECMTRRTGLQTAPQANSDSGVDFHLRSSGARWLKVARNEPSFCDLAFSYAGSVYAVSAVEVDKHPDHGSSLADIVEKMPDRAKLLAVAEAQGLIPCVFPAERNYTPDLNKGWNLWDLRTLTPVFPEKNQTRDEAPASEWEALCAAIVELGAAISRSGGHTLAYHDTPGLAPHLWYRDAQGQLSWVIIHPHISAHPLDRPEREADLQILQQIPGAKGYSLEVEAWGNAVCTAPALRGEPLYLRLSKLHPLQAQADA